MKEFLQRTSSRKLFVFVTATALLVFHYISAGEWIIVACAYMGMNVLSAAVNGRIPSANRNNQAGGNG